MSKSVRPKDLTDKISFGLTKNNISAAYFIVWTDKIFKISPNDAIENPKISSTPGGDCTRHLVKNPESPAKIQRLDMYG